MTDILNGAFIDEVSATEQRCASQLMGPWAVEDSWFQTAWSQVKGINLADAQAATQSMLKTRAEDGEGGMSQPFNVVGRTAIIPVMGPLSKHTTSFQAMVGGTSTAMTRKAIRMAAHDDGVDSILFHIDSPGGTVHGNGDLADDIRMAGTIKPTIAFGEDLVASAAMWIAAQANVFVANRHAQVGSIGTIMVLHDMSKAMAKEGIEVVAIRSAPKKARPQPGEPITKEIIADFQENINTINQDFIAAISEGRGMSMKDAKALATGEVWKAEEAKAKGLVDVIGNIDDAFALAAQAGAAYRATKDDDKNE